MLFIFNLKGGGFSLLKTMQLSLAICRESIPRFPTDAKNCK